MFSLGVAAGRRGWLETLRPGLERRCGVAGAITALAVPAVLLAGGFFEGEAGEDRFAGAWHWQAAAGALAEGVLATCVSSGPSRTSGGARTTSARRPAGWRPPPTAPSRPLRA